LDLPTYVILSKAVRVYTDPAQCVKAYPRICFAYRQDRFAYPQDCFAYPQDCFAYPQDRFAYPQDRFAYNENHDPDLSNYTSEE